MEEAGLQVEKLALSAAEGLGEYGRTKAAQSRESVEKVWLKSLSIAAATWQVESAFFSQPVVKLISSERMA